MALRQANHCALTTTQKREKGNFVFVIIHTYNRTENEENKKKTEQGNYTIQLVRFD